jgi:hypothetical protein
MGVETGTSGDQRGGLAGIRHAAVVSEIDRKRIESLTEGQMAAFRERTGRSAE